MNPTLPPPINPKKVFYISGTGDVIDAHKYWSQNPPYPTEISITFSSQIEQYCQDVGAELYMMSCHKRKDCLSEDWLTIEQLPKLWPNARGIMYHRGKSGRRCCCYSVLCVSVQM